MQWDDNTKKLSNYRHRRVIIVHYRMDHVNGQLNKVQSLRYPSRGAIIEIV